MDFYTLYFDHSFPFPKLLSDPPHFPIHPNSYPLIFSLENKHTDTTNKQENKTK